MDKSRLQRYIEKIEHIEERVGDIKTWLVEEEDVKEVKLQVIENHKIVLILSINRGVHGERGG